MGKFVILEANWSLSQPRAIEYTETRAALTNMLKFQILENA